MDKTENRIITATVECIEKFGLNGTTNRRIAELAGVNNAAINYYFRSKEILIQKVMETTLNNAFDWKDFIDFPRNTIHERCIAIFDHLVIGGLNYPAITQAHFYDLIVERKSDALVLDRYNEFIEHLVEDLDSIGTSMTKEELKLACVQLASTCFMTLLVPQLTEKLDYDLRDDSVRINFISTLVFKLFAL